MLLSDHLVLLEFELSLHYEKLIVLIFKLLVEMAYLRRLGLEGS